MSNADNTCETKVTFRAFKDAVAAEHWETVIAENLIDLMEDCGEDSDASTVIKEFTDLGYTSESYIVRAEEYGSFTVKNRLFFVNFLGTSPLQSRMHERLREVLLTMKINRGDLDTSFQDFLGEPSKAADVRPKKSQKTDPAYKHEHMMAFMEKGLSWPPADQELLEAFGEEFCHISSQRKLEALFFAAAVFPMQECYEADFIDAHKSLRHLVGDGDTDPWRHDKIPTVLSTSEIVMRFRVKERIRFRQLTGMELFAYAGWHSSFYKVPGTPAIPDWEVGQLCGNAFNGFAVAALFAAVMSVMSLGNAADEAIGDEKAVFTNDSQVEQVDGSNCSESESSDDPFAGVFDS